MKLPDLGVFKAEPSPEESSSLLLLILLQLLFRRNEATQGTGQISLPDVFNHLPFRSVSLSKFTLATDPTDRKGSNTDEHEQTTARPEDEGSPDDFAGQAPISTQCGGL
ncbi:hypothetical protein L3Y34_005684 [Caenorhabditis briggsae]|uniref:Uncharacterized protein n=1 Tax=Caenorhabditis briggsae TaxID=6238 RepID=A0AAE9IKQ4_CAEBR|nr:hypothetical protein L3Y34_005684 [Caenorhabditis briggsae]